MKCHVSLVGVALLLGCGMPLFAQVSNHPSAGSPLDRARLEEVVAAWVTLDASRAAPLYATDDPDLVIYDVAPLKYTGWEEVEKGAVKVFRPIKSMTQKLSDDVKIHNSDNTAWATATLIIHLVNKDGSREQIPARWTTIWERRGTSWVIVHEHLSTPPPQATDASYPSDRHPESVEAVHRVEPGVQSIPKPDDTLEALLLTRGDDFMSAWKKHDRAGIASTLAPEFVAVGGQALATGVDDTINALMGCDMTSYHITKSALKQLSPTIAVLITTQKQQITCLGHPAPALMYMTDTYVKRDGKWLILFHTEAAPQ